MLIHAEVVVGSRWCDGVLLHADAGASVLLKSYFVLCQQSAGSICSGV